MNTRILLLTALLPLASLAGPDAVLRARMSEIMIPTIEMENATVREVLSYLHKQSQARDIDGKGINLFVRASKDLQGPPRSHSNNQLSQYSASRRTRLDLRRQRSSLHLGRPCGRRHG
jgi:hypothetical protein